MHQIEFRADPKLIGIIPEPVPANSFIPKWFSKMPLKSDENNDSVAGNVSMKTCPGIIDAFSLGYVVPSWCDFSIHLKQDGQNTVETNWKPPMFDIFSPEMSKKYQFDSTDEKVFIRIITPWTIKTSEGTSTLITNPKWRPELNHKVYEGVVDTDVFYQRVHFVIVMKKYTTLEIKKGDPLCQIIPFSRDPWTSKIVGETEQDLLDQERQRMQHETHIIGGYRKEFWQDKTYK